MIEDPNEMGERPPLPDPMRIEVDEDDFYKRYDKPCRRCGQISPFMLCRDCYNYMGE